MIDNITNFIIKSFPKPWPDEHPTSRFLIMRRMYWLKLLKFCVVLFIISLEMTRKFVTWLIAYVTGQPLPIAIVIGSLTCLLIGYGCYVFFSDKNRRKKKRQMQRQSA